MAQGTDLEKKILSAGQRTSDGNLYVGKKPDNSKSDQAAAKYGRYASQVQPPETKGKLQYVAQNDRKILQSREGIASAMQQALSSNAPGPYLDENGELVIPFAPRSKEKDHGRIRVR